LIDDSRLKEHKERFVQGGIYHKLIDDKDMSEYAILDFRTKRLIKASAGIWHIEFSEDFKEATLHRVGRLPQLLHLNGNRLVFEVSLTEEHYNLEKVEFLPKLSFAE
jgi:hypothetical protein